MANNYLITGYWGEPHVTSENDRGINAATFGAGRFVLPVGQQFRAEYIGNNTVRVYDGKLMDNGAAAGIPAGEYVDLLISNASQSRKRNDLIVFQYSQDASTLIEHGVFTVIKGTETSGTPSDPKLTQADLLSGNASFDQMALWRVSVSGTSISAPVRVFSIATATGIEDADHPGCYYRTVNGVKEWVNPPMVFGVEYRTTERWNGKIVYSKVVDCGKLPNTSEKNISHGITGLTNFLSVRAMACLAGGTQFEMVKCEGDSVKANSTTVTLKTLWDATSFQAYTYLKYVKD